MITRYARELERGDRIWIRGRWRTIIDLTVEAGAVRLDFDRGRSTRLPTWYPTLMAS